ncbi:hypothetical protein Tco_0514495 [Tanacetum coccineum]
MGARVVGARGEVFVACELLRVRDSPWESASHGGGELIEGLLVVRGWEAYPVSAERLGNRWGASKTREVRVTGGDVSRTHMVRASGGHLLCQGDETMVLVGGARTAGNSKDQELGVRL